jgi:hypothetical protein
VCGRAVLRSDRNIGSGDFSFVHPGCSGLANYSAVFAVNVSRASARCARVSLPPPLTLCAVAVVVLVVFLVARSLATTRAVRLAQRKGELALAQARRQAFRHTVNGTVILFSFTIGCVGLRALQGVHCERLPTGALLLSVDMNQARSVGGRQRDKTDT